jgi:hypothetical protein
MQANALQDRCACIFCSLLVPSASVRVLLLLLQLTGLISLLPKLFDRTSDEETDERRLNHQGNKWGCF